MTAPSLSGRNPAKRRTFAFLVAFVLGFAAGYGIFYLDRQASVPRIGGTEVFEVALPDGTVRRLSYPEFERTRQELNQLRQRLAQVETSVRKTEARARPVEPEPSSRASAAAPAPGESGQQEKQAPAAAAKKNLGELFAKIFNTSMMDDLVLGQVSRQAGELTDVLRLTAEQQKSLKDILEKRQRARFGRRGAAGPGRALEEAPVPAGSPEEEIRGILTPEQSRKYQEYSDKKNALGGASVLDKEVFELTWRLNLNEEQEVKTRAVLQEHQNRSQNISPISTPDEEGEASYTRRIEEYLKAREDLDRKTGEEMRAVLNPAQMKTFRAYQGEKDVETRLFRKLLQEEVDQGSSPAAPPP